MGETSTSLGVQCFNQLVTHQICERLPHILQHQTHQIKEDGREKLEKIVDIINEARANAEKKATELPGALQNTSRTQQYTTGKTSNQPKNSDTAPPTIRPAPELPEGHQDTADKEDHRQKEATEEAKSANTHIKLDYDALEQ